ncbi:hypothetical protein JHW38_08980 [Lysobacter enzymogenes]|nr:hypothetical protein JHW38_08980 [Lysobacter enzymogenes]
MIMLLVMMLLGLAILRSTVLEERMSANMYDRSIAFESAELALREAEDKVGAAVRAGSTVGTDCSAPGARCPAVPASVYTAGTVCSGASISGCWVDVAADLKAPKAGAPQYYVEYMGRRETSDDYGGVEAGYESGSASQKTAAFYRVTARSHNPAAASGRAVVVLQTTLMSY